MTESKIKTKTRNQMSLNGDTVVVARNMQEQHPVNWHPDMDQAVGLTGRVMHEHPRESGWFMIDFGPGHGDITGYYFPVSSLNLTKTAAMG